MILVDTNVLSELTRLTPEPRVIAWLEVTNLRCSQIVKTRLRVRAADNG